MNRELKNVALALKIFVLYVHREYTTHEIGRLLLMRHQTVSHHLNKVRESSPLLKEKIDKQAKFNKSAAYRVRGD